VRILTAEAMREVDRRAIAELGIPGLVLMENNGGDGLAIARHLAVRGYDLQLFLVLGGRSLEGDAGVQLAICERMGLALTALDPGDPGALTAALAAAGGTDLVVDALFGTGLGRPLAGGLAELVEVTVRSAPTCGPTSR
jgi:ADP-dependent NAD(P)H-hydrate dehydratase / NAD(P)H-hydrate epimerase